MPLFGRFKGESRGGKSKSPLWCFLGVFEGAFFPERRPPQAICAKEYKFLEDYSKTCPSRVKNSSLGGSWLENCMGERTAA